MKKCYINPEMDIVTVGSMMQAVLVSSLTLNDDVVDGGWAPEMPQKPEDLLFDGLPFGLKP